MDDMISRKVAIDAAIDGADDWDGGYNPERERYIREHMTKIPAVDAVPVVHAKWDLTISMHYGERWQADASCSCCDFMKDNVWSGYFPDLPPSTARSITRHYAEKVKLPAYCERCGAKMDGET